ncbi:hypothetical protein ABE473_17400 [Stenotrophomonas sp. TWI700]|uniref:hypothetical protein n=1 Tax=Stenotrophomonas sp. TWI700 TaxID=3136792 RepID=UPI0032086B00
MRINTDELTDRQLLELHCTVMDALRKRGVIRSSNNPVADYTETLVARALNATLASGSQAGFDAVGQDGTRYQIKGRRLTAANKSTQLSALRNLSSGPFDQLAAVAFNSNLIVEYAALIPLHVVQRLGRYRAHTNSHTLYFRRALFEEPGVIDITSRIAKAMNT